MVEPRINGVVFAHRPFFLKRVVYVPRLDFDGLDPGAVSSFLHWSRTRAQTFVNRQNRRHV